MINEEQERLVDEAWQRVWNDHLRNQEDIPISKHSFYMGFREAMRICNELNQAIEKEYKSVVKEKIGYERLCDQWNDKFDRTFMRAEKLRVQLNKAIEQRNGLMLKFYDQVDSTNFKMLLDNEIHEAGK
jgi:hypothetical protein